MTHIAGHPVIDRMAHALGIAPAHTHAPIAPENINPKPSGEALKKGDSVDIQTKTSSLKNNVQIAFANESTPHYHETTGYGDWKPFKSSKTGAAVGAMSGFPLGLTAGMASTVAVAALSKDYKTAIAVGASVFVTSVVAGSVGGAVGYKARSMNVDLTEPPMGSMNDSPAQVVANEKKADAVWKEAFKQH